jgi:sterol desaturase/sphingolipid hydroxylase (fatty acid hydroxylase superfamily)
MGIYLILLTINVSLGYAAITAGWDYGATNFVAVLLTILFLALMERWRPYRRDWHPTAREWRRDGLNFLLVFFAGALSQAAVTGAAVAMARSTLGLPLLLEAPLALAAASLVGYAFHRYSHANRWLWMVHGIHHLPLKVNVANNMVVHFIEVFASTVLTQLTLYLLGVSAESALITGLFTPMQGYFIHANIDARMGWLNYVIACPEGHRMHHSRHVQEAGNFGSELAVWDSLFGTMTWRPGKVPATLGTDDEANFPSPFNIRDCVLYPLKGLVEILAQAARSGLRGGKKAVHLAARLSSTVGVLVDLPDPTSAPGLVRCPPAAYVLHSDPRGALPRLTPRSMGACDTRGPGRVAAPCVGPRREYPGSNPSGATELP